MLQHGKHKALNTCPLLEKELLQGLASLFCLLMWKPFF